MGGEEDKGLGKPSSSRASNASREPYAYTPSWMTAAERSKLKARIRKIKKKEGMWGMKKEEDALVKSSVASKDNDPLGVDGSKDKVKDPKELDPRRKFDENDPVPDHGSGINDSTISESTSQSPERTATTRPLESGHDAKGRSSKKKGAPSSHKKSSHPNRNSKESLSKKKSKEELTMAKKKKHPKAVHANPSGNLVMNEKPRTLHTRNTLEDHLWVTDFEHFDPRLYSFKTPEKLSTKRPVVAECPPFWVLNDHTIAVAWKLYCKEADRGDLGIVALQWSREFVSAMKDETGEYPIAIKHLLDAIEDGLIYRYSRAAEDSKKAHQKSDNISYASSDSVFKPQPEVSHTLKDIMSRNFPGRQSGTVQQISLVHKNDTPIVHKTVVPIYHDAHINQKDILAVLQLLKMEQEGRVKHAMDRQQEIEKLLSQAEDGKMPKMLSDRKDHVEFLGEEDYKKPASTISHQSAESAVSEKSLHSSLSPVHPSESKKAAKDELKVKKPHSRVSVRKGTHPNTPHDSHIEKEKSKDDDWDKSLQSSLSPVHPSESEKAAEDELKVKKSYPGVSVRNGTHPNTPHDSYIEKVKSEDDDRDKSLQSPLSPVHPSESEKAAEDDLKVKKLHPGVSVRNETHPNTPHDSFIEKKKIKDDDWDKSLLSLPPTESSVELSDSLFNDSKTKHTASDHGSKFDNKAAEKDTAKKTLKDSDWDKHGSAEKKKSKESLAGTKSSKGNESKPKKGSLTSKSEGKKKSVGGK